MPKQTSQMSNPALKSLDLAEFVVTSTRTQKPTVSAGLNQLFYPDPPQAVDGGASEVLDFDHIQDANADLLEKWSWEVRRTDQEHRHNLVRAKELRRQRKEVGGELREWHRGLRKSVEGTYGDDALPIVGLDAPPARRHVAVREQLSEVVERMRDQETPSRLPAAKAGLKPLDLKSIADALEIELRRFAEILKALKQRRKMATESRIARKNALKTHRRVYVNVAHIQEGYYRLVGLDDLADRIRTAGPPRRSAPKTDETEAPAEAAETEPAATPETPTSSSSSQEE